jgi:hypothetical protein
MQKEKKLSGVVAVKQNMTSLGEPNTGPYTLFCYQRCQNKKSHSDFLLFQHRSSIWYYFITDTSRSLSKVLLGHSTFLPSPTFQFCSIVLFEFFWVRVSMFQNALNYFDENKKYFVSFSRLQILILKRQAKNVWLITWNLKRSNKINERKLVSTTECH